MSDTFNYSLRRTAPSLLGLIIIWPTRYYTWACNIWIVSDTIFGNRKTQYKRKKTELRLSVKWQMKWRMYSCLAKWNCEPIQSINNFLSACGPILNSNPVRWWYVRGLWRQTELSTLQQSHEVVSFLLFLSSVEFFKFFFKKGWQTYHTSVLFLRSVTSYT